MPTPDPTPDDTAAAAFLNQLLTAKPAQIDRERFLRQELTKHGVPAHQIEEAIATTPQQAGIDPNTLNHIAQAVIRQETNRSTAASIATSFGGFAVALAAVPADFVQYYVHALRIARKLAALYIPDNDTDDTNHTNDIALLGAMLDSETTKTTNSTAKALTKSATSALTQTAANDITQAASKRALKRLSTHLARKAATRTIAKSVPVIGGAVAGALTHQSLTEQATRLHQTLRDTITPMNQQPAHEDPTPKDIETITKQLGREPRGVLRIAYRTPDGQPAVVTTHPLVDGTTPFPTLYYLTDPRLTQEASRLEVAQTMKWMEFRLAQSEELQNDYQQAHEHYLNTRNALHDLGTDFSGGGMPERVKCLHVLIAYALAEGPDRVRFGTEAVALAAEHGNLRGTSIPSDWPTLEDLGISLEEAGEGLA